MVVTSNHANGVFLHGHRTLGVQMTTISCILFDLGGVLVRNAAFDRLNALLPASMELDALKAKLLASPSFRAFELGNTTPEAFALSFVAELELRCTPVEFLEEFETWPEGFYRGAAELLAKLRTKYKLACLSNSNALHWARFGGFHGHFDVALSSHLLHLIKPDAACFRRALTECETAADEVLFFDDAIPNVEAARSCGIRAFHVRDFDDVRLKIEELGLLSPTDA